MNQPRYSHASIYFREYLYVFGGRNQRGESMCSVERMHLLLHPREDSSPEHYYMEQGDNRRVTHGAGWEQMA